MFFGYSYYFGNTQQNNNIYACAPITATVANQSAFLLNSVGYDANVKQHPDELSIMLSINNVYIARVVEGCNAISIIILFIAFIVAFSSKITTTALYILFGSLLIYVVNIIRIAFITVAFYKYPDYQIYNLAGNMLNHTFQFYLLQLLKSLTLEFVLESKSARKTM